MTADEAAKAKAAAAAQGSPFAGLAAAGLVKSDSLAHVAGVDRGERTGEAFKALLGSRPVPLNSAEGRAIVNDCKRQMDVAVDQPWATVFEDEET